VIPGEIVTGDEPVELNPGRPVTVLRVVNGGDRPVQVGSHFHFAEVNPALRFDRAAARGQRLAVAAGTSVRFEPASSATCNSCRSRDAASPPGSAARCEDRSMAELGRDRYAALYGPTVGDRVRLADTDLWIEVEEDRCGGGRIAARR